jgi:hypothetical protein
MDNVQSRWPVPLAEPDHVNNDSRMVSIITMVHRIQRYGYNVSLPPPKYQNESHFSLIFFARSGDPLNKKMDMRLYAASPATDACFTACELEGAVFISAHGSYRQSSNTRLTSGSSDTFIRASISINA